MWDMTIGSLFSGIDGLALGLERAGLGHVVWQAETDPDASSVLAHHWPGVPNLEDVSKVDWAHVEPVDVLCGGASLSARVLRWQARRPN
jgi:DNA (cytosine-5)-methyltransferase 1